MKFNVNLTDTSDANYLLAVYLYGVICLLKKDKISIEDSQNLIFLPKFAKFLRSNSFHTELIGIVDRGMELEDIVSLLSDKSYRKELLNLENDLLTILNTLRLSDNGAIKLT